MSASNITLRAYQDSDFDAAIELWRRTWQRAYPDIDFAARLDWWRARWQDELVPHCAIILAEQDSALAGFVTIDPAGGYLDQLVVAPEFWGSGVGARLVDEAKNHSPFGITLLVNKDNARAITFYTRCGFVYVGEDLNPVSGRAVNKMTWTP